jgi:hypothetical protein
LRLRHFAKATLLRYTIDLVDPNLTLCLSTRFVSSTQVGRAKPPPFWMLKTIVSRALRRNGSAVIYRCLHAYQINLLRISPCVVEHICELVAQCHARGAFTQDPCNSNRDLRCHPRKFWPSRDEISRKLWPYPFPAQFEDRELPPIQLVQKFGLPKNLGSTLVAGVLRCIHALFSAMNAPPFMRFKACPIV